MSNLTARIKAAISTIDARIKLLSDEDVNNLMESPYDPWVLNTLKSQKAAFIILLSGSENVDTLIRNNIPKRIYERFVRDANMVLSEFYGGQNPTPDKPNVKPWGDRR